MPTFFEIAVHIYTIVSNSFLLSKTIAANGLKRDFIYIIISQFQSLLLRSNCVPCSLSQGATCCTKCCLNSLNYMTVYSSKSCPDFQSFSIDMIFKLIWKCSTCSGRPPWYNPQGQLKEAFVIGKKT